MSSISSLDAQSQTCQPSATESYVLSYGLWMHHTQRPPHPKHRYPALAQKALMGPSSCQRSWGRQTDPPSGQFLPGFHHLLKWHSGIGSFTSENTHMQELDTRSVVIVHMIKHETQTLVHVNKCLDFTYIILLQKTLCHSFSHSFV